MFLTTTDRHIIEYLKGLYQAAERNPCPDTAELQQNVFNMDVCDYLRLFPDNSVRLILTDEPYGQAGTRLNLKARSDITTDFEWSKLGVLPTAYDDLFIKGGVKKPALPTHLTTEWVFEAARVLEEHGHLINFGMSEFSGTMRDVAQHAGLIWRASGPWLKTNPAPHFRKNNLRSGYENFFIMSKGTTKGYINFQEQQEMINFLLETTCPHCKAQFPITLSNKYTHPKWFEDVGQWFEISPLTNKKTNHPTEKPEWLLTKLITIYSNEGDLVVDPFGGSGSTSVVAKRLGREWATNDLTPEWYEHIKERMSSQIQTYK
jgi:site-specific DNA-methyltransferase (adenine-specific)